MHNPYGNPPGSFTTPGGQFYNPSQVAPQGFPQQMGYVPATQPLQPRFDPRPYNQFIPQQNTPAGRIIDNPAEIQPIEVPMTGEPVFFPMRDGSAVICKCWRSDGNLVTMRYIPEVVDQPQAEHAPEGPSVIERLEQIQGLLEKLTE